MAFAGVAMRTCSRQPGKNNELWSHMIQTSLDDRRFPFNRNPGVILIRPGAAGNDDEGLIRCLVKALLIAGHNASWFRGKKLDFSSDETITIRSRSAGETTHDRFLWRRRGKVMRWID